jgi:uncharacterized protein YbjT (DUF2867 family)
VKVAVLGGTGLLGRRVVRDLARDGIDHTIAGRSAEGWNSVRVDITTGEGISDALTGCDTVIFLSSNPAKSGKVDVEGTRRLLPLIDGRHLIYISIVGVDHHPFRYYRAKYEVEQMIAASVENYSILRATQFHDLLVFVLAKLARMWPYCLVPGGFVFQPVVAGEVAGHLVDVARSDPAGLLPDLGGPEVIDIKTLARTYMTAIGRERPVVGVYLPGSVASAFRRGLHTNPDRAVGRGTWEQHLESLRQVIPR